MKTLSNKKESEKHPDPTLEERTYEPNHFSESGKWKTRPFRDPETDTLVTWVFPYAMPQLYYSTVLGVYYPQTKSSELDRTKEDAEHTYKHEIRHAKGDNEYLAEYHTAL